MKNKLKYFITNRHMRTVYYRKPVHLCLFNDLNYYFRIEYSKFHVNSFVVSLLNKSLDSSFLSMTKRVCMISLNIYI